MGVYLSLNTLSDEYSAAFGLFVPLLELQRFSNLHFLFCGFNSFFGFIAFSNREKNQLLLSYNLSYIVACS